MEQGLGRMIDLQYLVTGTGRCGTVYMARLLSSLGLMCGHEAFFDEQGLAVALERLRSAEFESSWVSRNDMLTRQEVAPWFDRQRVCAESSYMAAPFMREEMLREAAIVHVLRHPLKVVSSFVQDIHFFNTDVHPESNYRSFVLQWVPEVMRHDNEIERACEYWIQWNEMIERNAAGRRYLRFQVESQVSDALLDFLQVPAGGRESAFRDDRVNTWRQREQDLRLEDIPAGGTRERLVALAERYGYAIQPPEEGFRPDPR
jgi:hypothetical protein